jgi:hypothetical protein
MKYLILILAVTLTACGGGGSVATQVNPFQEALGKSLPTQPAIPTPTDPFAPLLKKNGG